MFNNKKKINLKNKFLIFLILFLFVISSINIKVLSQSNEWWNKEWSFRQKIEINIDTSLEEAKYQPIDIRIKFENTCWAESTQKHSIRIIYQDSENIEEIESQIYDLLFIDDNHISECSIVFLIPDYATDKESYYAYYDNLPKPEHSYQNHIELSESYYKYEPIPGYPFESEYFKIKQDGNIIYGVAKQGEFLGYSTAQQITKFKENTKQVSTPKDSEAFTSFDYFYYYGKNSEEFSSTIDKLISKNILIEGNLMVKFEIISQTLKDDFQSKNIYTYYYCPGENKRIYCHVEHKALKPTQINIDSESFGNICSIQIGRVRSPSIEDLNFGRMFPYIHVYSEENIIQEYKVDPNPDYNPEGIMILKNEDDIDLGENAWVSFDEGESGFAHAIILDSTDIIKSGTDERCCE